MQHSGKWNTTSQILKPKNIKLRDINGLTSSQIKKMSVRCRSQVTLISGKVRQPKATAINKRQNKDGYILMCVAHPREDCVIEVGVESHSTLYQNPFKVASAARNSGYLPTDL